jgi:phage FluMu protein Com
MTKQFRCPKCLKLLFKIKIGDKQPIYKHPEVYFDKDANEIVCVKCGEILKITKRGLESK